MEGATNGEAERNGTPANRVEVDAGTGVRSSAHKDAS